MAFLLADTVSGLPAWGEAIVAASAVLGALVVLWKQLLRPALRFTAQAEEMIPLLRDLTATFRGTPHAFKVLDEIVGQFRTDSGSSLRDVVDRLDAAAKKNQAVAANLRTELAATVAENRAAVNLQQVAAESARQLAERDREQLLHLILMLDRLTLKVDTGVATVDRVEGAAAVVAADLFAAHARADAVMHADEDDAAPDRRRRDHGPGAAADAAAASPVRKPKSPEPKPSTP